MIALPDLRRLAVLLVLMPQLLVLGLGRGVILCVAPGGHVEVEIAAVGCCADSAGQASAGESDLAAAPNEPDCGSCSDLEIAMDLRASRTASADASDPPPDAASPPSELRHRAAATDAKRFLGHRPERGRVAPHLTHLKSVLLRC